MSRATIYRRDVTRDQLVTALTERAGQTFRNAIWPAITGRGTAAQRLEAALEAMCSAADEYLPLLAGMFLAHGEIFHQPGPEALTVDIFAEPLSGCLSTARGWDAAPSARDGHRDGAVQYGRLGLHPPACKSPLESGSRPTQRN